MTVNADTPSSECAHAHHSLAEDLHELLDKTWDEERVLENLRLRFLSGKPYTGVGDMVVALNPCKRLADLYDRDTQVRFPTLALLFLPLLASSASPS